MNALTRSRLGRRMARRLGLVALPELDAIDMRAELERRGVRVATPSALGALSEAERRKSVVVVQDAFTTHYDSAVVLDLLELMQRLGFQAVAGTVSAERQAAARPGLAR